MQRQFTQGAYLSVLTHAPVDAVKQLAETILESMPHITVLKNQTGLSMVPYRDSANGTVFHLGEVLVAEAYIQLDNDVEGYGMVMGRDNAFAMAVAILDAAMQSDIQVDAITEFVAEQHTQQAQADTDLLKQVEATRVEMETF